MNGAAPHPAYRIRKLATAMAQTTEPPTRNQALASDLAFLAALLWEHGDEAFERSADWANTGLVSGGRGPGGSGGDPSRPTEAQALGPMLATTEKAQAAVERDRELASYNRWLRFYRGQIADLAQPMRKILDDIATVLDRVDDYPGTTVVTGEDGHEKRVPVCAEFFCDDPADQPTLGRCKACAKWRERWLEAHPGSTISECPVVPKHIIDQRAKRRRRQAA